MIKQTAIIKYMPNQTVIICLFQCNSFIDFLGTFPKVNTVV